MKKRIMSIVTALAILSIPTNSVYSADEDIDPFEEVDPLRKISKQFGSYTDHFYFTNYQRNFNDDKLNEEYSEFLKKCTNAEIVSDPFKDYRMAVTSGCCMGISVCEILSHNGVIKPSDIKAGANILKDITRSDEVDDIITGYQALQERTVFDLYMRWFLDHYSYDEQVDILLDTAEKCTAEGRYFLVNYYSPRLHHAVAGIGLLDGEWTFNDEQFDKCILTLDSNAKNGMVNTPNVALGFVSDMCIYVNSETKRMYAPGYNHGTDQGLAFFVTDDDTLLNYKGQINPSEKIDTDLLHINKINVSQNGEYSLIVQNIDGTYYEQENTNDCYCDGKIFTVKNISSTDLDVDFTDIAHRVIADTSGNADSIFKDDSQVSIVSGGEEVEYNISVILNEGSYDFSPHYRWIFDGSTDSDITVRQTDKGMLLSSSDDINCQVTTYDVAFDEENCVTDIESNYNTAELCSSESLMIYFNEKDELQYYEVVSGDINADGKISVADAVTIQNYLLGRSDLINWRSADINGDEIVDVFDLLLVRKKILNMI